jgi:nucleoside 2-deoxyribosyltransferase
MTEQIRPILVYLAGPIDEVTAEQAQGWREAVADEVGAGVALYSPAHAFVSAGPGNAPAVDMANRMIIQASDGMLAYLPASKRAFGTIREVEFARSMAKPVVCVCENPLVSLLAYDVQQSPHLDDGMGMLLEAIAEDRKMPEGGLFFGRRIP